jgi:hypothetical protein
MLAKITRAVSPELGKLELGEGDWKRILSRICARSSTLLLKPYAGLKNVLWLVNSHSK